MNRHATSQHNQLYFNQEMVPHLGLECQCCLRQSDLICVKSRGSCGGREGGEAGAIRQSNCNTRHRKVYFPLKDGSVEMSHVWVMSPIFKFVLKATLTRALSLRSIIKQ